MGLSLRSGRDCRWGGVNNQCTLPPSIPRLRWDRTPNCSPGAAAIWLPVPTAPGVCSRCVCVHYCVCALGWVKCRAQIPSMGHHTWPHVTSITFIYKSSPMASWDIKVDAHFRISTEIAPGYFLPTLWILWICTYCYVHILFFACYTVGNYASMSFLLHFKISMKQRSRSSILHYCNVYQSKTAF